MKLGKVVGLSVVWLITPLVMFLIWGILHLFMPGLAETRGWDLWVNSNVWHGNGVWLWLWITSIISIMISLWHSSYGGTDVEAVDWVAAGLAGALLASSFTMWLIVLWDNDKDAARYYDSAAVFYVPDTHNIPASLHNLAANARIGNGQRCDLVGAADVPGCIKQGTLPMDGWEPRVSSADGAIIVMKRTSGDNQAVNLDDASLTYLNASSGQPARWSAIRDGSGIRQPMEGVVEWSGSGNPTECTFQGSDELNRALDGGRKNSLKNLLADKFPALFFNDEDAWGYCDGSRPVIVFPMQRQISWKDRTVNTAAGIVVMHGSPSGNPVFTYEATAHDMPGPVYPMSLVDTQREASTWAAGREFRNRSHFGYEPVDSSAQAGNVADYLLESKADGHMYWVSPLTLRGSNSQLFVSYALTRADEVTNGQLNELSIYVLAENDSRRINIDNLEASARDYVSQQQPGFFSSGGKLLEFTPTNGDTWRAFGELRGRVIYRLDISATNSIQPNLVSLEPNAGASKPVIDNEVCGTSLAGLSQSQLANCLKQFADELSRRTSGVATGK